jgi:DUF4097 and DUF4098 domain-containing protein YvlB
MGNWASVSWGSTVVSVGGGNSVVLREVNGVRRLTVNGQEVPLEGQTTIGELKVTIDGRQVFSNASQALNTVEIYAQTIGEVHTASGDVHIHGPLLECKTIDTASGDVTIEGDLRVTSIDTASGNVTAHGKLECDSIDTASGDVKGQSSKRRRRD